ncbi:hypothetical protein TL16_g01845 [Triparma laevis f. inornata]|uniref:Uncharacterized protein n=1 Tax=Triparma laevis f. inornata TaxID=1714386 RepID=A0A9W6ZIM4_9STRA|nr:hypothetical protein TL16_g01845 [Triparma laevis f. inornata]
MNSHAEISTEIQSLQSQIEELLTTNLASITNSASLTSSEASSAAEIKAKAEEIRDLAIRIKDRTSRLKSLTSHTLSTSETTYTLEKNLLGLSSVLKTLSLTTLHCETLQSFQQINLISLPQLLNLCTSISLILNASTPTLLAVNLYKTHHSLASEKKDEVLEQADILLAQSLKDRTGLTNVLRIYDRLGLLQSTVAKLKRKEIDSVKQNYRKFLDEKNLRSLTSQQYGDGGNAFDADSMLVVSANSSTPSKKREAKREGVAKVRRATEKIVNSVKSSMLTMKFISDGLQTFDVRDDIWEGYVVEVLKVLNTTTAEVIEHSIYPIFRAVHVSMFNKDFVDDSSSVEYVTREIEEKYQKLLTGEGAEISSGEGGRGESPLVGRFLGALVPWSTKFLEESEGRLMELLDLMFPRVSHDDAGLPSKYDISKFVDLIRAEYMLAEGREGGGEMGMCMEIGGGVGRVVAVLGERAGRGVKRKGGGHNLQLLNVLEQLSESLENALASVFVEPYKPAVTKEQIALTQKGQAQLNEITSATLGAVINDVISASTAEMVEKVSEGIEKFKKLNVIETKLNEVRDGLEGRVRKNVQVEIMKRVTVKTLKTFLTYLSLSPAPMNGVLEATQVRHCKRRFSLSPPLTRSPLFATLVVDIRAVNHDVLRLGDRRDGGRGADGAEGVEGSSVHGHPVGVGRCSNFGARENEKP